MSDTKLAMDAFIATYSGPWGLKASPTDVVNAIACAIGVDVDDTELELVSDALFEAGSDGATDDEQVRVVVCMLQAVGS